MGNLALLYYIGKRPDIRRKTMYTLYYSPGACSMAVHAILNDLGVPYQTVATDKASRQSESFLKLNPRAQVPVLTDEGLTIFEGAAIITWLCDKHGFSGSWTTDYNSAQRATCLQWLAYCNATLHGWYSKAFWTMSAITDEAVRDQCLQSCYSSIQSCWDQIEHQLTTQDYLCGSECSPADILMTVIANWFTYLPNCNIKFGPCTTRTLKSVSSRPSFQQALSAEQVTYKAAA